MQAHAFIISGYHHGKEENPVAGVLADREGDATVVCPHCGKPVTVELK